MQEACRTIQFPSFSDKMASVLLSIYGVSSAVTCCLVHCTADRKSPCLQHPGVQLHPFLLVTAWTLLAPIWCAKTKRVHGHCLTPHTPLKRGGLEATEHQLLWCDSGWHRSTEMGQIITFPIPCQESKCNLLLLAKTGVTLICWALSWVFGLYFKNNGPAESLTTPFLIPLHSVCQITGNTSVESVFDPL